MHDPIPFQFEGHTLRFTDDERVVAADLAAALGYRDAANLARTLDDDERGTQMVSTPSGDQMMTVITEAGFYRACLNRQAGYIKDVGAREFVKRLQRWVTHEVLPQIRKTGSYSTALQLTGKELLAAALLEADQVMKQQAATIETQRVELAAAAPKVHAWDGIVSGAGDYTITDAAKVLARAGIATGPRKLHQQMLELGWLYKNQRDKWTAKQAHVNDGCLAERARYYTDEDGVSTLATPQVRITAKGLEKLRDALAPQQSLAVSA